MSQARNANTQDWIGQDGKPMIHTRHLARLNSDNKLYLTVMKKVVPIPTKTLATANIIQLTEKNPTRLATIIMAMADINGGFRPIRSPSCPAIILPRSIPAIWMVITVLGMKSWSQTKEN